MSRSLLVLLVALLALASLASASRPSLVSFLRRARSPPPAIVAAAGPSIRGLSGCYYATSGQLQCPVGVQITVNAYPLSNSAAVTVSVGSYACSDVKLNATFSTLSCTLPSSIQASDYNTLLPVTVTLNGDASTPYNGVTFVQQPVLPVIQRVQGCLDGSDGNPARACRTGQLLTLTGDKFYFSSDYSVFVGSYDGIKPWWNGYGFVFTLPAVSAEDLNTPLPVTLTLGGYSATYEAGVISYGELALTSVTGCGSIGAPTGCSEGDVITLTGSGFNLGPQGDRNALNLRVTTGQQLDWVVQSNTQITATLPQPNVNFGFKLALQVGSFQPLTTAYFTVEYAPALIVTYTGGGVFGCDYSAVYKAPACAANDVLFFNIAGGALAETQAVTLRSPASDNAYDCGSLYFNRTRGMACTVPQVDAVDVGELLSVTVTVAGQDSAPYPQGLVQPLA